ncbi:membrane protein [Streptomyces phage Patelgo]|nr:membrane protein [Streptomyces phage Patelgo]
MEILFWIWVVPAVFFTGVFLLIVLFGALLGIQTGSVVGGLAMGIFGPPVAVILGAAWPVSWPLFSLFGILDEKRTEKNHREYEERLANGENYGKLMKITEIYPHLEGKGYLGSVVKIVEWKGYNEDNAFVEFVDQSIRSGRFYWAHDKMEAV